MNFPLSPALRRIDGVLPVGDREVHPAAAGRTDDALAERRELDAEVDRGIVGEYLPPVACGDLEAELRGRAGDAALVDQVDRRRLGSADRQRSGSGNGNGGR